MKYWLFALITTFFIINTSAYAGGVSLGATRLIYKSDDKVKQLAIYNSDNKNEFLMQSWIEDENGNLSRDLAVIPPLVLIKAGGQNSIRLIRNNSGLSSDHEMVYWLNVKAIPEKNQDSNQSTLQFAITSRIKVFYRPAELQQGAAEAYRKLQFRKKEDKISVFNPTPYYITLTNIRSGKHTGSSLMLAPKETRELHMGTSETIEADSINDYGGLDHLKINI
ncbi:molecular chaperone [Citrobacter sp. wls710]|uniref:fimbrial biogenesis chaperone n=1 Tax=Citrobacter sp. wls710 TaxID=2576426 RepID=UPI0010C9B6E2|nr:molecular chaperone [Citrobacter sp. wls710]TKU73348.1 molecular chaperone [Citrobacter sp. wls710]